MSSAPSFRRSLGHDAAGNAAWKLDNEGRRTEYEYDLLDRLTRMVEDKNTGSGGIEAVTELAYNGLHRLTRLTDSDENFTEYAYDDAGRLTGITFPDTGVISFDYSAWPTQRTLRRTDQRDITTAWAFNELHQLTGRSYDVGWGPDGFTWSKAGRLLAADNAAAEVDLAWDAAGRADLSGLRLWGAGPTYQVDPSYLVDPATGLDRRTAAYPDPASGLPTGRSVTHSWDQRGRLGFVADGALHLADFGYDLADRLISAALNNGVASGYDYDAADRLTGLTHFKTDPPPGACG